MFFSFFPDIKISMGIRIDKKKNNDDVLRWQLCWLISGINSNIYENLSCVITCQQWREIGKDMRYQRLPREKWGMILNGREKMMKKKKTLAQSVLQRTKNYSFSSASNINLLVFHPSKTSQMSRISPSCGANKYMLFNTYAGFFSRICCRAYNHCRNKYNRLAVWSIRVEKVRYAVIECQAFR